MVMHKLQISWLIFIFILGISFPSFLSIPSKSREFGGVLIGTSEYHKEVQCLAEAAYHEELIRKLVEDIDLLKAEAYHLKFNGN